MKKRLQGLIIGLIIGVMISSVVTFAKSGTDLIEAWYSDIKIFINGQKINPTDVNGNTVEPFIYNGTTYLPVRAVGQAFGMDVDWDNDTKTVYIGEKPSDGLIDTNTSSPTLDTLIEEVYKSDFKDQIEEFRKQGIILELLSRGNSLVYKCTVEIDVPEEMIPELQLSVKNSLSSVREMVSPLFDEVPIMESVIIEYYDIDNTKLYSEEFTR